MHLRKYNIRSIAENKIKDIFRSWRIHSVESNNQKKLRQIRKLDVIKIAFILHDASMWKTENLYLKMLTHPRFKPTLYTTLAADEIPSSVVRKYSELINYISSKHYKYFEISSVKNIDADIVFYEKPYDFSYLPNIVSAECQALIAYAPYGFNTLTTPEAYNQESVLKSFQFYVENNSIAQQLHNVMDNKAQNAVATGTPVMDMLLEPKTNFRNPWKPQDKSKRRIIWAPHFTIHAGVSWLNMSSFINMHEYMLDIAERYSESVQFAFKPHPLLYNTLLKEWGKERTNSYYEKWNSLPNCQYVSGEYMGLFKFSDAMIHDCGSFLIEYLYTGNPVMYTVRDKELTVSKYTEFAKKAFDLLTLGESRDDVEKFIENVICGVDVRKKEREEFKNKFLIPPKGQTACENIIEAILGENGYR